MLCRLVRKKSAIPFGCHPRDPSKLDASRRWQAVAVWAGAKDRGIAEEGTRDTDTAGKSGKCSLVWSGHIPFVQCISCVALAKSPLGCRVAKRNHYILHTVPL